MSERCRLEYLRRHEIELSKLAEEKNRDHLERQRKAGELFKIRNGMQDEKPSKECTGEVQTQLFDFTNFCKGK